MLFRRHLILPRLIPHLWQLLTYRFATLMLVHSQVETRRVVNLQPVGLQDKTRWHIAMWQTCNSLARDSPLVDLQFSNTNCKYINPSKAGFSKEGFLFIFIYFIFILFYLFSENKNQNQNLQQYAVKIHIHIYKKQIIIINKIKPQHKSKTVT